MYRANKPARAAIILIPVLVFLWAPQLVDSFEHPTRFHHRRPSSEAVNRSPSSDEFPSMEAADSIRWRTHVLKRKGKPSTAAPIVSSGPTGQHCADFSFGVEETNIWPTCTYKIITDINPERLPSVIHHVKCLDVGCKCTEFGDYRCAQLKTKMEVVFAVGRNFTNSFEEKRQTMDIFYGCVCAAAKGGVAKMSRVNPVRR